MSFKDTLLQVLSEQAEVNASERTIALHNSVKTNLKSYYDELRHVDTARLAGDHDAEATHLRKASDHHSEAAAHHKELISNAVASDFSEYKAKARTESGWSDSHG